MCAPARPRACARSRRRRCRSARGADGGYLVPAEVEREIGRRLAAISPIRAHRRRARDRPATSTRSRSRPPARRSAGSARRRRGRRPTTPTLDELSFPAMELYAMPAATADAARRRRRRHRRVDRRGGRARLRRAGGHGLRHRRRHQQAEGLPRLHHGRRTRSWEWGKIGYIATGVAGALCRRPTRPTCWSTWSMR